MSLKIIAIVLGIYAATGKIFYSLFLRKRWINNPTNKNH